MKPKTIFLSISLNLICQQLLTGGVRHGKEGQRKLWERKSETNGRTNKELDRRNNLLKEIMLKKRIFLKIRISEKDGVESRINKN
jgi:hypothetical protein